MSTTTSAIPTPTSASQSCITVAPGKDGYVPSWACNSNYNYDPSFSAAVAYTVLFGITTFLHIFQAISSKRIRLCWVVIMGASWEFISFGLRAAGAKNQQSTAIATASQLLLLLAPMWVNAFDYMVLGRMIYFFLPEQQVWGIKGIKLTKIFVWLDIASFLTQVAGGLMISPGSSPATLMTGIHVYMGGIGLQQFCILVFTAIATGFFIAMRRLEQSGQILDSRPRNWRALLFTLYASLALITTRIIFRLIEFAAGDTPSTNPIPFHEVYVMVLDALPMFIALVLMNIVHPGRILTGEGSEFPKGPTRKEKKEAKRMKKEAKAAAKVEKKMQKESTKLGYMGLREEYV